MALKATQAAQLPTEPNRSATHLQRVADRLRGLDFLLRLRQRILEDLQRLVHQRALDVQRWWNRKGRDKSSGLHCSSAPSVSSSVIVRGLSGWSAILFGEDSPLGFLQVSHELLFG